MNHREAVARYWSRMPVEKPHGANPTKCEPFRVTAAANTQRLDCARRRECLTYAVRVRWESWTCEVCGVRETVAIETPTRTNFDGVYEVVR
jgi:hypothetical protein